MKNSVPKILIICTLFFSQHIQASTISWNNINFTTEPSNIFTLDIVGSGFNDNVDGGGVNFTFDQTVLNVLSVSIDGLVWDFGGLGISTGTIDNAAGTVDGILVNTFANVTGDFVVASIEFQAIGLGVTSLSLSEYTLNPWASGGSAINPAYINGLVTVIATAPTVPIPAAIWLFGSGLLALVGFARRKTVQ